MSIKAKNLGLCEDTYLHLSINAAEQMLPVQARNLFQGRAGCQLCEGDLGGGSGSAGLWEELLGKFAQACLTN